MIQPSKEFVLLVRSTYPIIPKVAKGEERQIAPIDLICSMNLSHFSK